MIAHIDADSFFASVLVRLHPHLKGKHVLAIGMGGSCVIAATYEAKRKGVKTGMRLQEARLLVPDAIEMSSDFRETGLASEQIKSILRDLCPVIEQMSIDEWFLDLSALVGGVPEHPDEWAKETRLEILKQTDLSMSVGIAPTKTLAKMASEYRKPAGITVLTQENTEVFLRDRPVAAIPGIGRQRTVKIDALGWITAWDFTQARDEALTHICGCTGLELKRELHGQRVYTVSTDIRPPKSISRCRTFRATTDSALMKAHLLKHLEYCTMKMRRQSLVCKEVSIHVRTPDYHYSGAHHRFVQPCCTVSQMLPAVLSALERLAGHGRKFGQVGLALHGLVPAGTVQSSLFENIESAVADEHLQAALDTIQTRFGRDSVTRGAALQVKSGTKQELEMTIV